MCRPTLIDLNPFVLNYYPFIIIVDECNRNFTDVDGLSMKMHVPRKTNYLKVKALNLVTMKNKIKHW